MELTQKEERLYEIMKGYAKKDICIAFSGGADSSLLLKLAVKCAAPGVRVHAVTFETVLHPSCDLDIAKQVAKETGYIYVDTGAMYRGLAIHFLNLGIDPKDTEKIIEACKDVEVTIGYESGIQQIYVNGENVTAKLRTEEVGNMASMTSAIPEVRGKLLELQRTLAREKDVIMDGRDIGTHVLPDADVKIYLTASVEIRAKRRYKELVEKGVQCDLKEIEKDIEERDYRDMTRKIAPLKKAEDAILVDSSDMTLKEVVNTISRYCHR